MVAIGIHVGRLLHDEIPSAVRTGVASGVSALSWIVFLPIALGFGVISTAGGLSAAGWFLVALAALTGVLLTATALLHRRQEPNAVMPDELSTPNGSPTS